MQKEPGNNPGLLSIYEAAIGAAALGNHYTQAITPFAMLQTLADCECVAVPLHEPGGPATFTMTTVTFCDGLKPCRGTRLVAVPPKYAPLLSAAYCSS